MHKGRTIGAILTISAAALAGIATHEGFRDKAYIPVPGDVPTIGYGSTRYPDGRRVTMGDTVDTATAHAMMRHDAQAIAQTLANCIGNVPLHRHEADAIVSLAYNVGAQAICKSTLVKKLKQNPPDYAGMCAEFDRWVYFQKKKLPGLVKRRAQERALCEGRKGAAPHA